MQLIWCTLFAIVQLVLAGHPLKKLIIDTDMLNFDDDPMAIGFANIFQRFRHVEILGIMSSVRSRYAPPGIDAINTYYDHGTIPVAIQKPVDNSTINSCCPQYPEYLTGLTYDFPEDIHDGSNTTDPVTLYRKLLAAADDNSITVAAIGFFDNLYHLSLSGPDSISPLTGSELLQRKVTEMVVQGDDVGNSFNIEDHNATFGETVLNEWKGRLVFVPDAIGEETFVGKRLTTKAPAANPVAYAVRTCIGYNQSHEAWDLTAMYYAICGARDAYVLTHSHGVVDISSNGSSSWNYSNPSVLQHGVKLVMNNETFAAGLESILLWGPDQEIPFHGLDLCDLDRWAQRRIR